jgi:hypothetical protein
MVEEMNENKVNKMKIKVNFYDKIKQEDKMLNSIL